MLFRNILLIFISLLFLTSEGSGTSDVLLNGTSIYLATGESYGIYQGYVISLKSVSSDGSIWLQLIDNGKVVKSDIVRINSFFNYNKTNRTILSITVYNIYSGSSEQDLVALYPVYQYMDPDLPAPSQTGIIPENNLENESTDLFQGKDRLPETPILVLWVVLTFILFYVIRKLW